MQVRGLLGSKQTETSVEAYIPAMRHLHIAEGAANPFLKSLPHLEYTLRGVKRCEAEAGVEGEATNHSHNFTEGSGCMGVGCGQMGQEHALGGMLPWSLRAGGLQCLLVGELKLLHRVLTEIAPAFKTSWYRCHQRTRLQASVMVKFN